MSNVHVGLLGSFLVSDGETDVRLTGASERLLAYLALRDCWVKRTVIAGTLWPEVSDVRAHASLRTALARIKGSAGGIVEATHSELRLAQGIAVDLSDNRELALRLLDSSERPRDQDVVSSSIEALSTDLLPNWYDDWVLLDVEDWRQLRLHALEALAEQFVVRKRFGDATRAALAAVRADPLRESPRVCLIRVHLAEGNRSEALREFVRYEGVLSTELGIGPSPMMRGLIAAAGR